MSTDGPYTVSAYSTSPHEPLVELYSVRVSVELALRGGGTFWPPRYRHLVLFLIVIMWGRLACSALALNAGRLPVSPRVVVSRSLTISANLMNSEEGKAYYALGYVSAARVAFITS